MAKKDAAEQSTEKGALVIVPSSAVDTMNLGAMSGLISLGRSELEKME